MLLFEEISVLSGYGSQTNLLKSKKVATKLFKVIKTPSDMRSVQKGTSTINTPYKPNDTDTKIHGLTLLMRKPDTIDAAIPPNLKEIKDQ